MPPVTEGIAAFGRLTPQERGRERNAVKVPEPQILEETVEVVRQRTSEQMADVPRCLSRRCRLIARERVQQLSAEICGSASISVNNCRNAQVNST